MFNTMLRYVEFVYHCDSLTVYCMTVWFVLQKRPVCVQADDELDVLSTIPDTL